MIFKPKISHQKPIKPPLKADFNAYFTQKRMIFTPIYKICATPKGPFRVRFPAGVPNKKEPTGSFLFGFRCGSEPVVRPIAQQWHEERSDEVVPESALVDTNGISIRRKAPRRRRCEKYSSIVSFQANRASFVANFYPWLCHNKWLIFDEK